ncbi:amino acid permease [Conexibacter sp. DBS9H8]|uniref:amino acid permease n=1 Tax=Conexibacter sp. DBS9H8 TaxID=2937801 RepID=UPI00200EA7A9|nr:amino acid permease [Conexibacter sp. DBS9H8]
MSARSLFGLVYAASVSSVYFALGVIAHHADGLTPEVFILAAVFFQLTAMTYAEGASLHPEGRGGAAAFGRYAFNELVSFVAAWSLVLDYTILIAVTALAVPAYLSVFWHPLAHGAPRLIASLVVIAAVSADSITGVSGQRLRRRLSIITVDLVVQLGVIVLGVLLVFSPSHLVHAVHLGAGRPSLSGLGFALPAGVIAFAGLETAASYASELRARPGDMRRLMGFGSAAIIVIYVGIAIVGVAALPVQDGYTALGQGHLSAPVLGIVESLRPHGIADVLKFVVGVTGAVVLASAAGVAQMGVSRVGYALATNRQIPSALGRLSARWSTPWIVIVTAAFAAAALVIPQNLEFLIGIYAFGALVAFTVAHVSIIALRFREPNAERAYRVPWSVPFRGGSLPLPTVIGVLASVAGWLALMIFHGGARYVGTGWLLSGLALYVGYRKSQGKPILRRVTIAEQALRRDTTARTEFGSILVPVFGEAIDDDIIQTAGRLAGETREDDPDGGAVIEAIWVIEVPMSLPLEAPLPEPQVARARAALQRAKQVGEEYEGVQVATAIVRARRAGQGIVREAQRRGVELIVLAAEEPAPVRGGARLGGRRGPLDALVGDVSRYVIAKAPCRVILTAAPDRSLPPASPPVTAPTPTDPAAVVGADPGPVFPEPRG